LVTGRVQGVGYREFVRRCALRLDVSGWVRNRTDGSVEALLQGAAANLDALLAEMRRGPPGSSVTRLCVVECEAQSRPFRNSTGSKNSETTDKRGRTPRSIQTGFSVC
jgi:acylphosphatase